MTRHTNMCILNLDGCGVEQALREMKKTYTSRELIKMLKTDGWNLTRVKGDHHQFHHPKKKGTVTIQHPVKDLSGFVVRSLFKQAGWK